jgi:hypothetical protein
VSFLRRIKQSVESARADHGPDLEDRPDDDALDSPPSIGELAPIRIYTQDDRVIDGWTETGSQRLSDLLNAEDTLSISRVPVPAGDDWEAIDRENMRIVVVPPQVSPRQLRVHRSRQEMTARCADYAIVGTVHLIPGNKLDRQVLRTRQHFLPITNASGETTAGPDAMIESETILLNIVNVSEDLELSLVD